MSNTAEAFPTAKETKASVIPTLVCGAISAVIGAVPGTGGDIAAIICWQQTKNFSKHPEEFGKGAVNGLAVTSCANNAVIGGAMTTMMTLGIPGDGVTAVLIGSLMMYGMQPGPMMFVEKPEFVYNVMGLMVVGYIMILILGLLSTKFASLILKVPQGGHLGHRRGLLHPGLLRGEQLHVRRICHVRSRLCGLPVQAL